MKTTRPTSRLHTVSRVIGGALAVLIFTMFARSADAQVVEFDTTHTLFYEAPTGSHMLIYTPGGDLEATPFPFLTVRAGYEADVVSGASVAVKAGAAYQATHPDADVVTAASVHDVRNAVNGGFTLRNDDVQLTGGYYYSTEHDYKSNSFNVAARTDAYEHNTQFEISYARNFDRVCDRVQSTADPAPLWRALEDSSGCFTHSNPLRDSVPVAVDGFQGTWSQAWTPIFSTQVVYTAQIVNGFQSNPYRSVILGEGIKAQEHEPDNRLREAVAARANFYIRPLRAAIRLTARGYWDSWDIKSGTGEAEFEKYFGEAFRASARGRYYKQSGAVFWSDDYTGGNVPLGPRGQYWTGDRELSPFSSWSAGLRALYTFTPSAGKTRILAIMTSLKIGLSADLLNFHYDQYTLGGRPIDNARAYIFGLNLTAQF